VVDIITVADQPTLGFAQPTPANVADHVAAVAVLAARPFACSADR
jgi:hypothetical protein